MSRQKAFYHWQGQIVKKFVDSGVLSLPQAYVLAIFSFGIVRAACCALTAIAGKLGFLGADNTVLQRLKYWLRDGVDKRTPGEPQIEVQDTFLPLIRWILSLWQGRQLALAIDATTLRDDLVVLAVALLYRGTAIPLAWVCLPANCKGAWMPHILRLLRLVHAAIPDAYDVLVMADRGLYSPKLYKRIRRYHWHPLLRIKAQGSFKPRYRERRPLREFLPGPGYQWRGRGWAFKRKPLRCTLLAIWLEGQAEPWFLLTDLSPHQVEASWYGLRVWIELGFRVCKSIGWQWHRSRITIPQRAERLWLALSLATIWTLVYGTHVEDQQLGPPAEVPWPTLSLAPEPMAETDPAAPPGDPGLERVHGYQPCTRKRRKSLLRQGLEALSERIWGAQPPLRRWRLIPEPWPGVLKNG
jgi:hypothetical protein